MAFAGGHIAGEGEIGKRRECDIVRPADAGFEHPAAPHRNPVLLAEIVDAPRYGVAANPAQLDVDDLARAQLDGGARLLFRVNALVQANRAVQLFLHLTAAVELVPANRL